MMCPQCSALQTRIDVLEDALVEGARGRQVLHGLSRIASTIVRLMAKSGVLNKAAAITYIWGDRPEGPPLTDTISVLMAARIRPWASDRGIKIKTVWGLGYEVTGGDLAILRAVIAQNDRASA